MKIVPMSAELLAHTVGVRQETDEQVIELAGRTCYKSEDKITDDSAKGFVERIVKRGHLSVLEHCSVTIRIVCPRGVSHELVRHRLAAYSQESTRYVKYGDITVIEPPGLDKESHVQWRAACMYAETAYKALIDLGHKPQIARAVLPICLKTEVVTTFNLRQWLHVMDQRLRKVCHPEMRSVMRMCHDELIKLSPTLFDTRKLHLLRNED